MSFSFFRRQRAAKSGAHKDVFRAFLRVLERCAPRVRRGGAHVPAGAAREQP